MRALTCGFLMAAALAVAGCGENIDLTKNLEVVDVSTGWYDAGIVDGQNKLVPSISFKFKNNASETLSTLQANVLFRRVGEDTEWGSGFVRVTGGEGLPAGAVSTTQTVNCPKGYTGTEPRQQMLQNSQFVDARIELFAKYASTQWQKVGEYVVDRRLIEH
jgi:hypothetical protein